MEDGSVKIASVLFGRQPLRGLVWLLLVFAIAIQAACAAGPRLATHSFEFDARWDSPDIEILDYRYGNSKQHGTHPPEYVRQSGKVAQQTGTYGKMLVGDDLYAKWRIKSTGEVCEDTVDLKGRLPDDITNHRIHFIIKGPQLYVYLISPEKLASNPCPARDQLCRIMDPSCPSADHRIFSWYCSKKIIRLYPGNPEPLDIEIK